MSATRNPFYQLPGGADLPGDVRVSDTADASKNAAGGWAASPAAVAETQTYHRYTKYSASSNVNIISDSNSVYTTGKNVDVYVGITTTEAFYGTTVINGMPMPVSGYALAAFVDGTGKLNGFGWISNGNIRAPGNLPAGTWYIIAHYTTY